jgi:uncharacterized membrane protein YvlD (DUF360 family)
MGILLMIVGNAIALMATTVVPGITFTGNWVNLLVGGAIFGLFNLIVRPIAWVAAQFIPGYNVSGLVAGILGSLVVTVVSWIVGALVGGRKG